MEKVMLLVAAMCAILTTMIVIWFRGFRLRNTDPSKNELAPIPEATLVPSWHNRFKSQRLTAAPAAGDWITKSQQPQTDIQSELERISADSSASRGELAQILHCGVNPAKLIDLIARNPQLQTEICDSVNSPLFDLARPLKSTLEAITLLGSLEIRNILIQTCILKQLDPQKTGDEGNTTKHWKHGFAVSRVVQALAAANQLPQPENLSVAALLHDVGKWFTLEHWTAAGRDLLQQMPFSRYEYLVRERQWLGVDHGWLSGEMVRLWNLPGQWISVISRHHLPSYTAPSGSDETQRALATVHLADLLVHLSLTDSEEAGYLPTPGWIELVTGDERFESLLSEPVLGALTAEKSWRAEMVARESGVNCRHQPARWAA